jgi:germination protein M
MNKKLFLVAVIILSMLLTSCKSLTGEGASTTDSLSVYRVLKKNYQTSGELVRAERITVSEGDDYLQKAILTLNSPTEDPMLQRAFPDGVDIISSELENGMLSLTMTKEYLKLSGIEKTLADYCIALTLCELEDVVSVTIFVDGKAVATGLSEDDAMLYDAEAVPYEKLLRLYFPVKGGGYLSSEYHTLTVDIGVPIERYIIEELLRGPYDNSLYSGIPEGVSLISVSTEDDLCTVDFSEEFFDNRSVSSEDVALAVYSVVNSLTSLPEITSVKILIDGKTVDKYGDISLSEPLGRNEHITRPGSSD